MTDETFAEGMLLLREAYPARYGELDDRQLEAWRVILDSIPDEEFRNVVVHIIRTREKPPESAAVFFQVAKRLARPHVGGREALEKIMRVITEKGLSADPRKEFAEDWCLQRTVATLGWKRICHASDAEWPYLENKLIAIYDAIVESEELQQERRALPHPEAVGALPGPVHVREAMKLPQRHE